MREEGRRKEFLCLNARTDVKPDKRRRTVQEEVVVFRQRWFPNAHPVLQKQKLQISADGSKLSVRQAAAL